MSLRFYTRQRLVILGPQTSVVEAARAMEANDVGTVIVQDAGRVVGIATDRDIALRVIRAGRDAAATPLADIMTADVATLSPSASRMEAVRAMREKNVRRVPLVEGSGAVGLVTLDDLLLDEAVPLEELAAVVRAQLGRGGPSMPRARRRAEARAEGTYWRLISELRAEAKLETSAQAEVALDVALAALLRRLTPEEAEDLSAQLPSLLRARLPAAGGPDKQITRESIEAQLVRRLDVSPERAAEILEAVGATLQRNVSEGQMEDVRGQLPEEMRSVFPSI